MGPGGGGRKCPLVLKPSDKRCKMEVQTWSLGCGEGIRGGVPDLCYPDTLRPKASADLGVRVSGLM